DFLAMLSHELRNPLAAIHGAIEILQIKTLEDPQLIWARDVLSRQNRHLSRLIEDLLDVSRITVGKLNLHMHPVELCDVVQHAVETARPLIDQRRHTLTLSLPECPMHVRGDPVRLSQVVCNLLTNAAKYTEPGGRIALTLESAAAADDEPPQSVIRVKDNGRGISKEELSRVFEPAAHEERLNSGELGSLGIGLIVVRGLVQMHGGTVEVQSEGSGAGSEFIVRLPLLRAEEFELNVTPTKETAPVVEKESAVALRILVVDDNEDSASSMTLLLELQGHELRSAHSGESALALAQQYQPDVVLLDIGMPGMNGYEVAKRLRAQQMFDDTVLIAVTGYGRASDVKQTQAAGFNHHLVKPIDYERLTTHLNACAEQRSAREDARRKERTARRTSA
ncbi:MAG TPA: response regulator, partial [Burkholderiales bacterium]|nr:response regulator [Burkholderiales bacterium]